MPTINDATVVSQAYDTSGNGGRRLVRLSNGNQYAAMKNGTTSYLVYKSTDNWASPGTLWKTINAYGDISIATNGVNIYLLFTDGTAVIKTYNYDEAGTLLSFGNVDSGQSALGNVSLAINEAGTELHATWASKNSAYPNSFNIRYAKGTINAGSDGSPGSVTWGAVTQLTTDNNVEIDNKNPSVVTNSSGYAVVLFDHVTRTGTDVNRIRSAVYNGSSFTIYNVYSLTGENYTQTSPSAIFVPQSVNGLANGRIWVAWHGADATSTTNNIRYSYSDDGGVTWSAMQKLTAGINGFACEFPSITANKSNNIFIVHEGRSPSDSNGMTVQKFDGTSWTTKTYNSTSDASPSTLFDLSVNFTEPLFIYKNSNASFGTVGIKFYGTWTVTTISVTPSNLGTKTDRSALLSYAITTDGTMSTITEKVNGVAIGTKTATSGQSLIAGLTQAQWDAVRFGKYADATGGKNTLTVEMGAEKWTYTFDKRPATDADIISAVKAHKDIAEVVDPARRAKMAAAIRSKGGSVNDADAWETMAQAVGGMALGKKSASGTSTSTTSTYAVEQTTGSSSLLKYRLAITGLSFKPSYVIANSGNINGGVTIFKVSADFISGNGQQEFVFVNSTTVTYAIQNSNFYVTETAIYMPVHDSGIVYNWIAIE
ncbi:sialidase family protein [Cytobacillus oceanisediminis]|uniref:sialidase family protein n=1 Tax=Cytobacillus oceanisediminis TaxID=665099 RepID=UPI003735660F